jgi:hypothetical protein
MVRYSMLNRGSQVLTTLTLGTGFDAKFEARVTFWVRGGGPPKDDDKYAPAYRLTDNLALWLSNNTGTPDRELADTVRWILRYASERTEDTSVKASYARYASKKAKFWDEESKRFTPDGKRSSWESVLFVLLGAMLGGFITGHVAGKGRV